MERIGAGARCADGALQIWRCWAFALRSLIWNVRRLSHAMSNHYAKLVRVALIYGVVCYLVFVGLSVLSWRVFPDHRSDDDLTQQLHWTVHVVAEKIVGLILMSFTAFFAARSYRPTWKVGVATAIAAALAFQLVAVVVYLVRFGVSSYRTYNDFIYTISSAVMLAWLFGFFAVWKQYRNERHAV